MPWRNSILESFVKSPIGDYSASSAGSSEPTALIALALAAQTENMSHSNPTELRTSALQAADFLVQLQAEEGCVGMRRDLAEPRWPTSLALLVWQALDATRYASNIQTALKWTLSIYGERIKRNADMGHNSELAAWPWVEGTHSWLEPSALFTLALKSHGLTNHKRTREAVALLIDRLLPEGGCNYGNTEVLGQKLRAHVQPSGVVMLALVDEPDASGRVQRTLDYLSSACQESLTPNSLAWALLGLAAHGRTPENAINLLSAAVERAKPRGLSPYTQALLVNAALQERCLLIALPQKGKPA